MRNGKGNGMKRKMVKFMMKFYYKMICRTGKRFNQWCRRYTEFAMKYCREGGDSDA